MCPLRMPHCAVDEAIGRAVAVLQKASPEFSKNTGCVSCHHQTLPGMAAHMAKSRGIAVNEELMGRDVKRVTGLIRPFRAGLIENADVVPDIQVTGGYFTWYLRALNESSDPSLEALARSVALHQQTDGHWIGWAPRPPLESGDIQATALSIRTLQMYPGEARRAEYADRIAKAAEWLESAVPGTEHERVYQLLGLTWAGTSKVSGSAGGGAGSRGAEAGRRVGTTKDARQRCVRNGSGAVCSQAGRGAQRSLTRVPARCAVPARDAVRGRVVACEDAGVSIPTAGGYEIPARTRSVDLGDGNQLGGDGAGVEPRPGGGSPAAVAYSASANASNSRFCSG